MIISKLLKGGQSPDLKPSRILREVNTQHGEVLPQGHVATRAVGNMAVYWQGHQVIAPKLSSAFLGNVKIKWT